ncbi:hypothetical protein RISK_002312 [Rhodopirellula islandica]|uniref:Uncharacterized protein n=1 Tax=Rhodopirellula islandica TaxID=595434 RepID=A0A0J1BGL5_RHOIS|nr:hypothetical protein RISK_002312 [Rhodopirellula islandica]
MKRGVLRWGAKRTQSLESDAGQVEVRSKPAFSTPVCLAPNEIPSPSNLPQPIST